MTTGLKAIGRIMPLAGDYKKKKLKMKLMYSLNLVLINKTFTGKKPAYSHL